MPSSDRISTNLSLLRETIAAFSEIQKFYVLHQIKPRSERRRTVPHWSEIVDIAIPLYLEQLRAGYRPDDPSA